VHRKVCCVQVHEQSCVLREEVTGPLNCSVKLRNQYVYVIQRLGLPSEAHGRQQTRLCASCSCCGPFALATLFAVQCV